VFPELLGWLDYGEGSTLWSEPGLKLSPYSVLRMVRSERSSDAVPSLHV